LEERQLLSGAGVLNQVGTGGPLDGVAAGTDGNVWLITDYEVGRIAPTGQVQYLTTPGSGPGSRAITAGPDGNMWFVAPDNTQSSGYVVGRVTPDGNQTEIPIPTSYSRPADITLGPDGNLWFTESGARKIGRVSPAGNITEFAVPSTPGLGQPERITTGPDGALWFSIEGNPGAIGRITTTGAITLFPLSGSGDVGLAGITAGPDGALWFTETQTRKIGRITTDGAISEFTLPTFGDGFIASPGGIAVGIDGGLWFTETLNLIGRISTSGQITQFPVSPPPYFYLSGRSTVIATGPDGNLWFTEPGAGIVAQFSPNDPSIVRGVNARATAHLDDSLIVANYVSQGRTSSDFGTIDWGDGTTSAASFQATSLPNGAGSQIRVYSNHTFAHAGDFTVTTSLTVNGVAQTTSSTVHVVGSAVITAYTNTANSAVGLPNTQRVVARFSSADVHALADSFSATIDWGDGTTTPAIITVAPPVTPIFYAALDLAAPPYGQQAFVVSGNHAYSQPEHYTPHVNIIDAAGDAASVNSSISVAPAETLTSTAVNVSAFPGQSLTAVAVADFNDTAFDLKPSDYVATIDWGDGTTSAGKIQQLIYGIVEDRASDIVLPWPNPVYSFFVSGDHTYAEAGRYAVKVVISSLAGASTTANGSALVSTILPTVYSLNEYAGLPLNPTSSLGYVRIQAANAKAVDYSVSIDWGDGTTTTGMLTGGYSVGGPNGQPSNETDFTITGSHNYQKVGTYKITITVADHSGHSGAGTATETIIAESLTPVPISTGGVASVPLNSLTVGTFDDNVYAAVASDFTAVVSWGDGKTSAGSVISEPQFLPPIPVVVAPEGAASSSSIPYPIWFGSRFGVLGSHTYAAAGSYPVDITVTSKRGATTVVHSHITVTPTPPETLNGKGLTFFGFAGKPLAAESVAVGSFTDSASAPSTQPFTAVIDWGDGTAPSAGQIQPIAVNAIAPTASGAPNSGTSIAPSVIPFSGIVYIVRGNHTYSRPGLYQIHVSIAHGPGVSGRFVSGVNILRANAPETILPVAVTLNTPMAAPNVPLAVANFFDSDPSAHATDFLATIEWGDHTLPTQGVVKVIPASAGSPISEFTVSGRHSYSRRGTYEVRVTIARRGGASTDVTSTLVVGQRHPGANHARIQRRTEKRTQVSS
jgi:streptogramin lyase